MAGPRRCPWSIIDKLHIIASGSQGGAASEGTIGDGGGGIWNGTGGASREIFKKTFRQLRVAAFAVSLSTGER